MKCIVYTSVKKEGYYLYTKLGAKLSDIPEKLTKKLGKLRQIMILDTEKNTGMRQVTPEKLENILNTNGYYLYIQSTAEIEKIISEKLVQGVKSEDKSL